MRTLLLIATILLAACSTAPAVSPNSTPVIRIGKPKVSGDATPQPLPTADPALVDTTGRSPLDAPRQVDMPASENEVPMITINGLPAVEVLINGSGPYRFVLDWGANIFAMSPLLAAQLQLPLLGNDEMGNQNAHVESLAVGDTEFRGLTAVLDPFFSYSEEDGVLGRNVYESLLMTLDYPAHLVRWTSGQLPPPNGEDVLAYSPTEGGAPRLEINVAGGKHWAVVDTGASRWIIWPASQVEQLNFKFGPVAGESARGPQLGTVDTQMGRLADDLTFGAYTIAQPVVDIIDRPEILLGSRLLQHFAVTLDQQNQRLRFARAASEPIVIPTAPWEVTP